jgi:uncharacterized protein
MPRLLSSRTTVSLLKQDAKRWHASLRRADARAVVRLQNAWPDAPAEPALRDVQHALAREYGAPSWVALLERVADLIIDHQGHEQRLTALLSHGWTGDVATARRLVARYPDLRRDSLFCAAACGDVATVDRCLQHEPHEVRAVDPVRQWSALAHVTFGRLDERNALVIAQRLLDTGADVHFTFDDGWGNPFTLLTGVAGDGEGAKPPHPQAHELAQLLLAHGADPFDTQLLYNTSLHHDDTTWLELLWGACERQGNTDVWHAREGRTLGGRFPGSTLDYLLGNAITRRHEQRVRWLLAHGANANALHAYTGRPVHTEARLNGFSAAVTMLEAQGAVPTSLSPAQALTAAVLALDAEGARALLCAHEASLSCIGPLFVAAAAGNPNAVALALSLGADVQSRDHEGATALHRAVQAGSVDAVQLLIDAGAPIDERDARWYGSPLMWAIVLRQDAVLTQLTSLSRDVFALTRAGATDRLRDVLREIPERAREVLPGLERPAPLFCLPDEAGAAVEVTHLLLEHGADPRVRNLKGQLAADVAWNCGLADAAVLMRGTDFRG